MAIYGPDGLIVVCDGATSATMPLLNFRFSGILRCTDWLTTTLRSPNEGASVAPFLLLFINTHESFDGCPRLAVFAIAYRKERNKCYECSKFSSPKQNIFRFCSYHKIIVIFFRFFAVIGRIFAERNVTNERFTIIIIGITAHCIIILIHGIIVIDWFSRRQQSHLIRCIR